MPSKNKLRVLFVSSGNSPQGISPLVLSQGKSMEEQGMDIVYFTIKKSGLIGYVSSIPSLKRIIGMQKPDIIHAHYSLSGFVSGLTFTNTPIVVSLMGSDANMGSNYSSLIRIFAKKIWSRVIVKSASMNRDLKLSNVNVIPNGVDLNRFKCLDKAESKTLVRFATDKIVISFFSDPARYEKNFSLAQEAVYSFENAKNIEFRVIYDIPFDSVPIYLNATDILISSSLWEGSPNIIKEAMACNVVVVATAVGDIPELFDGTSGYFQSSHDLKDMIDKLNNAYDHIVNKRAINGREKIIDACLDSNSIAAKLCMLYNEAKTRNSSGS
ncbi:MAG: glycosyltransferase [Ignavibacteriales bacterium]|nr:glycosyltransferase [Melioribacteraceae bacterium]MCF8315129.1 glycosyltransferase [Ignavibacteriales bacterium]MCF8435875.1 glycosyltransferase [Ignavibacteriales bacterium]